MGPAPPRHGGNTWVRDILEVLLIAVVLYAVIWTCVETVRVDGDSMNGTLSSGDFLIASKISYALGSPARGDIVILDPPLSCEGSQADYIKRIIGLPGDSLEIVTDTQPFQVWVEPGGSGPWDRIEEPYVLGDWSSDISPSPVVKVDAIDQVVHIPSGMYFVMGDNRNFSCDSRYFGLVSRSRILAKAILRIWPFGSFGGLGAGPTLAPTGSAPPSEPQPVVGIIALGLPLRRRWVSLSRALSGAARASPVPPPD
ncbi:MAG TPA: signal peptidase I [Candidatus Binatia bacterium]|nr:signal peptidase I [Candidatus Binatia bacterium]